MCLSGGGRQCIEAKGTQGMCKSGRRQRQVLPHLLRRANRKKEDERWRESAVSCGWGSQLRWGAKLEDKITILAGSFMLRTH